MTFGVVVLVVLILVDLGLLFWLNWIQEKD